MRLRARWGEPCVVCDPEAVRFCAVGAISRAVFELLGQSDMTVVDMAASRVLAANNLQEASSSDDQRPGRPRDDRVAVPEGPRLKRGGPASAAFFASD